MTDDLIIAHCHLIAAEGAYKTAVKRHRASKHLHRTWVRAKARVAALEGCDG